MRDGDTFVVPKLDRLARSVPDARTIADQLEAKGVKLALGSSVYDPSDPMGKMFSNKQQKELCRMHATGDYSISDLAEVFTVSRPTIYRTLKRNQA